MEFLPQELVQAIVQEIDDIPSLKSCALTGSIFRDASQRILLHSLTLERDVQPAYTLLTESPRIASYITHLSITLERVDVGNDSLRQSLQQILAKLVNVRQCTLMHHIPIFLFDFLERQPLRKLKVDLSDGFSPASILRLLTMAPVVSFTGVVVLIDKEDPGPSFEYITPRVEELIVYNVDDKFYELLAHPQIKFSSTLRRLTILDSYDAWRTADGLKFMSIVAPTLEHLYLAGRPDRSILPVLSGLRSIALNSWFYDWISWLPDVISSVVRTSPLLDDIVVRFLPTYATSCPRILGPALTMLDADLAAHARRPVIRWVLDYLAENKIAHARIFEEFTTSVQTAMPKTHEEGRIILEDR